MKQIDYTGSILNNTNKIISDANSDWRGIRPGSYVKFIGHESFYTVSKIEKFTYIKEFENIDNKKIKLKDNVGIFLSVGDELTISYKEYELYTINRIIDGGQHYRANDVLDIEGGTVSFDVADGMYDNAKIQVTEIKPGGVISKLQLNDKGKYIVVPSDITNLKGGMGSNAKIEARYNLLDKRQMVQKEIEKIDIENDTIITLNYPIPDGVKSGKLSVEKYEIILNNSYSGKDIINGGLDIIRDFSLNYQWAFMKKNSPSNDTIYNQNLSKQDNLISKLEQRISEIEKKLTAYHTN